MMQIPREILNLSKSYPLSRDDVINAYSSFARFKFNKYGTLINEDDIEIIKKLIGWASLLSQALAKSFWGIFQSILMSYYK